MVQDMPEIRNPYPYGPNPQLWDDSPTKARVEEQTVTVYGQSLRLWDDVGKFIGKQIVAGIQKIEVPLESQYNPEEDM